MFDLTVNNRELIRLEPSIKANNNNSLIWARAIFFFFTFSSIFLVYTSITGKKFIYKFSFFSERKIKPSIKRTDETPNRKYFKSGMIFIVALVLSFFIIRFLIEPRFGQASLVNLIIYAFFFSAAGIISRSFIQD